MYQTKQVKRSTSTDKRVFILLGFKTGNFKVFCLFPSFPSRHVRFSNFNLFLIQNKFSFEYVLNNRIFIFPFLCEILPLLMAVAATPAMHIWNRTVQLPGKHLGFTLPWIICRLHRNEYFTFCLFGRDFWGLNYCC